MDSPREAPGDPSLFDIQKVLESFRDPLRVLTDIRRKYGDIVLTRFFNRRYYLVSDSEAVRHVLVENHKNYHKSTNYVGIKYLLGEGLLTSEGDTWRRQRKLAQPAFHHDKLAALVPAMAECTKDMLDRWARELPVGIAFDVHKEMMRLTFRIVGRTLLSAELDGEAKAFGNALNVGLKWANDMAESLIRVPPSVPTRKNREMKKAMVSIDRVVERVITERRDDPNPPADLLTMLMAARDSGSGMSDKQLRDELLTMVLAGHETTANTLTFTLFLLSKHPDVRKKVEAEVREVLGDRAPVLADLPKLRYTTQVLEESMRLYPPAWMIERQALEDDVICGYRVPKGSVIGISSFVIHRRADLWPNPEGFDPDRFTPANAAQRPKYAYMPFGGGPRTCIGNGFSMMELQVILPMIIQRTRLDLEPGFRLELDPSITLRPTHGIPVTRSPVELPRS